MKIQEGEKLGEKTGEISPLHLKYIFVWFYEEVLTKHLRRRSLDKTFTKKSWQNIYEEEVLTKSLRRSLNKVFTKKFMKIQRVRNEVRKQVTSHLICPYWKSMCSIWSSYIRVFQELFTKYICFHVLSWFHRKCFVKTSSS